MCSHRRMRYWYLQPVLLDQRVQDNTDHAWLQQSSSTLWQARSIVIRFLLLMWVTKASEASCLPQQALLFEFTTPIPDDPPELFQFSQEFTPGPPAETSRHCRLVTSRASSSGPRDGLLHPLLVTCLGSSHFAWIAFMHLLEHQPSSMLALISTIRIYLQRGEVRQVRVVRAPLWREGVDLAPAACVPLDSLDARGVVGNARLDLSEPAFRVLVTTSEALLLCTAPYALPAPSLAGPRQHTFVTLGQIV